VVILLICPERKKFAFSGGDLARPDRERGVVSRKAWGRRSNQKEMTEVMIGDRNEKKGMPKHVTGWAHMGQV